MSVKTKLIIIIAVSFAVFYISISVIIVELIHERTDEYYREWISGKKSVLNEVIDREFKSLVESYYYINRYNISPETILATHKYTAIVYYSPDGEVEGIYKNPHLKKPFDVNDAELISPNAKTSKEMRKGFCYHDGKLFMFISFPREANGELQGYVAVIKRIDQDYLSELRNILTVDVVEFSKDRKEVNGEISEFLPITNTSGIPVGYIRIAYRGIIDPLIAETYNYFLILSALILAASVLISSTLINRTFYDRISILSNFMKNIGKRGFRTGERIIMAGDDELKDLAESINLALDEIERSKREINGIAENLRVVNRILRHDILNDLTVIRGFAEIANERMRCDYCSRIINRAERAVDTITKLKNVEMALSESQLYPMKVSEVIKDVMKVHDIKWEMSGDGVALADDGLHSVFENLVSNAVKHGKTDRIKFEIKEEKDRVIIRVIDYGEGIPDSLKQRIFEEGFTLGEGSGLGLYIVKKLIERYGGKITVTDNRPSGAIFTIKLKRAENNMKSDES